MKTKTGTKNITIAEYMEYEARTKRQNIHPTRCEDADFNCLLNKSVAMEYPYYSENAKIDLYYVTKEVPKSSIDECRAIFAKKGTQVTRTNELQGELNPGSFTLLFTIGSLNLYAMEDLGASVNVMPKSMFEHLKLADLKKTDMLVEMADMTRKAPLGIVENILIDVFNKEISLGVEEDKVFSDMDGGMYHSKIPVEKQCTQFRDDKSIDTVDSSDNMLEPEVEHKNVINLENITSRWHVCKLVRVFYDNECGKDCGMWPTCNPDLSFCSGYDAIYGKGEHGMLEQWMCFRDNKRQSVGGNHMTFADFLKVRYKNKNIDNTIRERRYYEWVAQNSEFNDNGISHEATMYDNPYKYHHEYPCSYFPQKDKGMPKPWEPSFNEGMRDNPYSRMFDEYKKTFDYEVEQLANKYNLRIGKKGYALDDVWEKCEKFHRGTIYPWHDEGFEEE
ncbi:phospholipase-like protein [Tanacetum coccineum]